MHANRRYLDTQRSEQEVDLEEIKSLKETMMNERKKMKELKADNDKLHREVCKVFHIPVSCWKQNDTVSLPGFEPGTFGLEVQRAIHCATGTQLHNRSYQIKEFLLKWVDFELVYMQETNVFPFLKINLLVRNIRIFG